MIDFDKLKKHSKTGNIKPDDFIKLFSSLKNINNKFDYVYLFKKFFEVYQQSPYWKLLREEIIKIQGGKCKHCYRKIVNIHHLNYNRIGNENISDLVGLCRDHHKMAHGIVINEPQLIGDILKLLEKDVKDM
jgi:hypothetical protein